MTVKQRAWLRHYRLGASAGEAAKLAGYQGADSRAFASIGARNRKRLAAWLEEFEEKSAAVADLEEVNAFWSAVMRDTGEDIRNRLKASELRAKAGGAFGEARTPGKQATFWFLDDKEGEDHAPS